MTVADGFCDNPSDGASDTDDVLCQPVRLPPGDRSLAGTTQEGGDLMFAELAGVDLTEADFGFAQLALQNSSPRSV